jgi:hypothetical protein
MFIFDGESNKFNSLVAVGSKATSLMFPDDQGRNNHEKHQHENKTCDVFILDFIQVCLKG